MHKPIPAEPPKPTCPECKGALQKRGPGKRENSVRYFCRECGKWCTVCPTDPMPDGHRLRGVSTLVDSDGRTVMQWVKTAEDRLAREEALALALERLPDRVPALKTKVKPPAVTDADLCAVYPWGDPHIGLLAWAPETGEDHDLKIAEADLYAATDLLFAEVPYAERALLAVLGDTTHADNEDGTTARSGHRLDVDSRYAKVLDVALRTVTYAVARALAVHRTVHVTCSRGNHDDQTSLFLARGIAAYFRLEPRVVVDLSPARFHYFEFGTNAIGLYHGHEVKHDKLPAVMAADRPELWGRTKHRAWYVGHVHHSKVLEHPGCTVETFRTLAARDAWTHNNGYRSGRNMTRIVLHREDGEVRRSTADIARVRKWVSK